MKKLINFEYGTIHAFYWVYYGVLCSFASVFLLARGYSNSQIGVIFAVANIIAVIIQPPIADLADRSKKLSTMNIAEIIVTILIIGGGFILLTEGQSLVLSALYVGLIALMTVLQPLYNSLSFGLSVGEYQINFGIARSGGSLAYAAAMAVLGASVKVQGVEVIPLWGILVLAALMISMIINSIQHRVLLNRIKEEGMVGSAKDSAFAVSSANVEADEKGRGKLMGETLSIEEVSDVQPDNSSVDMAPEITVESAAKEINLRTFIKRHRYFFIINIGVLGIFFSNAVLNNYMLQIVENVGGDSEDMGRILSVMAFLEIPAMVCFTWIKKWFSTRFLLKLASVCFTVKILICFLANSVTLIYAAQLFQTASFGLFLPGMVYFTAEMMSEGEAVKGQALYTTMITVTTVAASLSGGLVLDMWGAKTLTFIATVATALGAAVIIGFIDKVKRAD